MSRSAEGFLVLAIMAAFAVPALTFHSLFLHVSPAEIAHLTEPSFDAGTAVLALLALVASFPIAGMSVAALRWLAASRRLRTVKAGSTPVEAGEIRYRRITGPEVGLFAAGFLRPEIFVTEGAERALSSEALSAALLHELAHIRHGDTRWRAAIAVVGGGFRALPYVSQYLSALVLQSEVAADRAATAWGARPGDLFEALVTASLREDRSPALTGGCLHTRLTRLAEPESRDPGAPRPGAVSIATWTLGAPLLPHLLLLVGVLGPPHLSV